MRKSTLRRYGGYAASVTVAGLAAFGVASFASGAQPFIVETDNPSSMSNSINYGDVVLTYKVPFASVGVGSVIAFQDPRGNPNTILHRVVEVESCGGTRCLVTKGDNIATNPTDDPWNVTEQYYSGKVLGVIPYAGYLSPSMYGFSGVFTLIPVAFVILLVLSSDTVRGAASSNRRNTRDSVKRDGRSG